MNKHTPGPWRYWSCRKDDSCPPMYDYVQFANPKGHVFRAPLLYLTEADARLIAAAPDLLLSLREFIARSEHGRLRFDEDHPIHAARAAIAKATGEMK